MAKISLRAYNREIEGMIDRGELNAAIAHCRHILKYYPKHIDTYRLLGKAYIEAQRYAEAADVLQRILSAVPDDFISQIGMSIVREDEGNLDAAIWHMERAFEAQPSNTAVQDELRRLYGRRDGVEPPKIRLTRGALVRMYARGELYQQAIAEIRAALSEEPSRVDLEIILARMYYLSNQPVPAIEICSRIISKLPYCFEANRILAEILPKTSRAEDAKIYQQRVYAMDPYLAYLPPDAVNSLEAPDNAVTLDRLEIEPTGEEAVLPTWAQTAGVGFTSEEEEPLPDWFSQIKVDKDIVEDASPSPTADSKIETQTIFEQNPEKLEDSVAQSSNEEIIPDWMREAGWMPTDTVDQTAETGFNLPEEELEIGEIPDWLQEIAPEETIFEEGADQQQDTEWLEKILPPQEEQSSQEFSKSLGEQQVEFFAEDSILEQSVEIADKFIPSPSQYNSQEDEGQGEPQFVAESEWLSSLTNLGEEPSRVEDNTLTDHISSIVEIGSEPSNDIPSSSLSSKQEDTPTPPEIEDMDAAIAWLESLAARQGVDEETLLTSPEERQDSPPDWIQSLVAEEAADQSRKIIANTVEEETLSANHDLEPISLVQPSSQLEDDNLFYSDLPQTEGNENTESVNLEQPLAHPTEEPLPDWLMESLQEEEPALTTPSEQPDTSLISELTKEEEIFHAQLTDEKESNQDDAAFAWLENLAAKQGSPEETLLTKPDERQEEIPDWVLEDFHLPETTEQKSEDSLPQEEIRSLQPLEFTEKHFTTEDTQPTQLNLTSKAEPSFAVETPIEENLEVSTWLQQLEEETEKEQSFVPTDWVPEIETPPTDQPQPIEEISSPLNYQLDSDAEPLSVAQKALQSHKIEQAIQIYAQLIKEGLYLEEIIHDLRDALYHYPIDISIWQTLGDAYLRSNRLQEALEAYTKAEELLR